MASTYYPFEDKRPGARAGDAAAGVAGGSAESAGKQVAVVEKNATIDNKYGLHARPAMQFVEVATKYTSEIRVMRDDKIADAKSIMEVLMLAAEKGAVLSIRADGDDAEQAVDALLRLVASKFDEE